MRLTAPKKEKKKLKASYAKPLELLNRILLATTKERDFVLDPLLSGTTASL